MSVTKDIKLGLLILSGAVVLISTLYIIGKNENYFGSHFQLRTRFANADGLMAGSNIRFSGLQAGTVRSIHVIDDTTIEAVLLIDAAMRPYIHKNAMASIGTEGLIGNKVVNILPTPKPSPLAEDGDLLPAQNQLNTDKMLRTLDKTNENVAAITAGLRLTVTRINESTALWSLLNDKRLAAGASAAMEHVRRASAEAEATLRDLHTLTTDIKEGKGSIGSLLKDTSFASTLGQATEKLRVAGQKISDAAEQAGVLASSANTLITDTAFVKNLDRSMENIRLGTAAFHEDMEALKHNFLLRGYFRKQEKAAKKSRDSARDHAGQ